MSHRPHEEADNMNDILSSSGGSFPPKHHPLHHPPPNSNGPFQFGSPSVLPSGVSSEDLMMPMVRSMSDASDFQRPVHPAMRPRRVAVSFGNVPKYDTMPPPGFTSPKHALFTSSSSGISEGTEQSFSSSFRRSNSNNFNNHSSGCEDEDYDLNMVFVEINALQNKCTDEDAESSDIVTPLANITSGIGHVGNHVSQSQTQQQQPQQQQQQQQQPQSIASSAATNSSTINEPSPTVPRRKSQTSITTKDGKLMTFNPELYDEQDILLSNEKYANNVRYLRDFRCEQCPLFLQHKCNQHKPFTCFNWHFANQRRRRPLRKRDGTFNYSPDNYCTKYDETTGICPDGDDCEKLHRTAGDTERRYHLRYYKTGMCIYETDSRGFCMKNGPHCAFAHGNHDLRSPVFDVREQASIADGETDANGHIHYEKDRNAVIEDPRWQDIAFVLAHYKTELCKRPQRLCRQGYACPQYHNNKDRRRSPKKFKYRSNPCPSVKSGDEWGDPMKCENLDNCTFCHTRTEQQFHPEIYKSNKCNDIKDSHYCPRGPFCAFAHSETTDDINNARDFATDPNSEFSTASQQNSSSPLQIGRSNTISAFNRAQFTMQSSVPSSLPDHFDMSKLDLSAPQPPMRSQILNDESSSNNANNSVIGPIARPRSYSTSNTKTVTPVPLSNLLNDKQKMMRNAKKQMFSNSMFATVPEQNSSNFSSSNIGGQFGFGAESSAEPTRNQRDDLTLEFESQFSSSLYGNQSDDNLMSSMFRRGSLLNDNSSSPINIPDGRLGYQDSSARSASASGFNISPPAGIIGTSPFDSSFAIGASPFGGGSSRQHQTSPQTMFEQTGSSGVNIRAMANEIQRSNEENVILKNKLKCFDEEINNMMQKYKRDICNANQKEMMAEHGRNEAINRMNSMKKDFESMRAMSREQNAFHHLPSYHPDMSRQQLMQVKQKLLTEVKEIDEILSQNS